MLLSVCKVCRRSYLDILPFLLVYTCSFCENARRHSCQTRTASNLQVCLQRTCTAYSLRSSEAHEGGRRCCACHPHAIENCAAHPAL